MIVGSAQKAKEKEDKEREKSHNKKKLDKKSFNKARSPTAWNLKPSQSQVEFEECLVPGSKDKKKPTAASNKKDDMSENEIMQT